MIIPKYAGDDCEFAATGIAPDGQPLRPHDVVTDLLDHVDEAFVAHGARTWSSRSAAARTWYDRFDWNRHWTPHGGCVYEDCEKLEMCTGATMHPSAYAALHIANLGVAEAARRAAEQAAPRGTRYRVTAENCDPEHANVSWGSHFNVAISTGLWEDLYVHPQRPCVYGFVVSALAAATAFFGGGHVLPLNNGEVVYSLSSRAHHLGRLTSLATTIAFERGITNSRREGFCENAERQHLINFDFAPIAARLRCSLVQCLFAAAELGFSGLGLYEPLLALRQWAFGIDLDTGRLPREARLNDGRAMTLPRYVRTLASTLLEMVDAGAIGEDVAPEAGELLPVIIELCDRLEAGDIVHAARHLDWAAKLLVILGICDETGARLGDPATRLASYDMLNTNPDVGWFLRLWRTGKVDPLVSREDVDGAVGEGPVESRAWGLGAIVARFPEAVTAVDWNGVELSLEPERRWGRRLRIEFPRLDSMNKQALGPVLEQARDVAHLGRLLETSQVAETDPSDAVVPNLVVRGDGNQ